MGGVIVLIELTPEVKLYEQVLEDLRNQVPATLARSGCTQATVSVCRRFNRILVQQLWISSDALDEYLTWRADRGDLMRISEILSEEQKFRIFHVEESASLPAEHAA